MTTTPVPPAYRDLPEVPGLAMRHAWDVWGRDDEVGTINLLDPGRVAAAAAGVRTGEVVPLDLPLTLPDPPLFGRQAYRHEVFALNRHEMDDRLDGFHLQGSTQWDSLNHVRAREHGYWGGRTDDPTTGPNGLGIDRWARRGIVGRGVLVDVGAHLAATGRPVDGLAGHAITVDELQGTLEAEGVTLEVGDILCLRTGWTTAYRRLDRDARVAYAAGPTSTGLRAGEDMAEFLWDAHVAALCCDNPAVEVVPGDPSVGSLHRRLIPFLGFALGEMFDLDRLAERCHADGRFTFLFVAAPLHVPDGLGSPGNAVAIR